MSSWIGLILFVASPVLGGLLWLVARIESPTPLARGLLAGLSWLVVLEVAALVIAPWIPTVELRHLVIETVPIAIFSWMVLVLPIVLIDVMVIGLARRVGRTPLEDDLSVADLGRFEARRRQLCSLALAKVFYMAAILGSTLGLLLVAVTVTLPYIVLFLRGRQAELFWWLALTLRNRLDPAKELLAFAETRWGKNRLRLIDASRSVQHGESLANALVINHVLSSSEIIELRIADAAGSLEEGFLNCARRYSHSSGEASLTVGANGAILWLWTIAAAMVAVLGFVAFSIIPKYKAIFADFGVELPPLTVRVMQVADDSSAMAPLSMSLLVLSGWLVMTSIIVCIGWQNLQWSWLQQMFPRRDAPMVMRYLRYLIRAQWPTPKAIGLIADEAFRDDLRSRLNRVGLHLETGDPLGDALAREGYVTPVEAAAITSGQRAGHLDFALESLADSLDRGRLFRFRSAIEIVKPVFLLVLACVIAAAAFAMFAPLAFLLEALA